MAKKALTMSLVLTAAICLPQGSPGQEPRGTSSENASLVRQLLDLTLPSHPSVMSKEEGEALIPKDKESEEAEAFDRQSKIRPFDEALAQDKTLSPEQKAFVTQNYDKLSKLLDQQIADGIKADFPLEQYIRESLERDYGASFSASELKELLGFFRSSAGRQVLKSYKYSEVSEVIVQKGGASLITKADQAEAAKFVATPLGSRFQEVFLTRAGAYSGAKMEAAYRAGGKPEHSVFTIMGSENIDRLFHQFLKDNYKK